MLQLSPQYEGMRNEFLQSHSIKIFRGCSGGCAVWAQTLFLFSHYAYLFLLSTTFSPFVFAFFIRPIPGPRNGMAQELRFLPLPFSLEWQVSRSFWQSCLYLVGSTKLTPLFFDELFCLSLSVWSLPPL